MTLEAQKQPCKDCLFRRGFDVIPEEIPNMLDLIEHRLLLRQSCHKTDKRAYDFPGNYDGPIKVCYGFANLLQGTELTHSEDEILAKYGGK